MKGADRADFALFVSCASLLLGALLLERRLDWGGDLNE